MTNAERWKTYVLCLLGWLFDFYDLVVFAYLSKAIARDWAWGARENEYKALVVGVSLAASGAGGILFGGLADRFGRRRVMMATILIYSVCTGLCGFAGGLASLVLLRALTGFGVGGEWATGHALMAEIFPKEKRGRAAAFLQAGEPIGVALAVLAGLWLEPRIGWRAVFWVSALPAGLVFLIQRHVRESPLWENARRTDHESFLAKYERLLRDHGRVAFKGWVLGASKLGTYWLVYVWLPEYFAELGRSGGLEPAALASLRLKFILAAQGGQLVGMLLFGWVSDALGRRPAFSIYSVLTGAGVLALCLRGADMLAHPAMFWPAMGAVGLGSGCTAGFGALLAELFPTSIRNTAMGAVYNLSRSFQFVTQLAMGLLATRVGVSQGLLLAAAFAAVTASWVWVFPETRGIELQTD